MAGRRDRRGVAALVGVALIWGDALSASSAALEGVAAAKQVALRFAVAALTLAVALPGASRSITRSALVRGLGLGILRATGFLLQTCALATTPVVTSAFLTGTVVVFAPVIAMIWGRTGLETMLAGPGPHPRELDAATHRARGEEVHSVPARLPRARSQCSLVRGSAWRARTYASRSGTPASNPLVSAGGRRECGLV